jgi:uncharacterized protein YcgI (DUF1989 family)
MAELRETSGTVPGKVILDHTIPKQEYEGLRLKAGQTVRVIDIEGEQVMDTVTLDANDPTEHSSMPWSNFLNRSWRLRKGHVIYSIRCNPMFKIVEDTVGVNYSGSGFCTAESNHTRYGVPHTRNCGDNLAAALAKFGIPRYLCAESGEFAIFMNVGFDPDGTCEIRPPKSKAGDYMDLEAQMDVTLALSVCPQERNPCNNFRAKPMRVIVYQR